MAGERGVLRQTLRAQSMGEGGDVAGGRLRRGLRGGGRGELGVDARIDAARGLRRGEAGEPFLHLVDRAVGY